MIDIIIPAYNAHKTIEQTLLSICSQTISPLVKVYIIDDCSEKGYDYLKEVFKDKLDITIIRNETNIGPGGCRNVGLDHAKGEYIFFLDSDDLLYNCYSLQNLVNTMDENPDVALVSGTTAFEDENGEVALINNHTRCLHAKLYRRRYLEKYQLRFNPTYNHEDASFHYLFLITQPKIKIIKNNIYFYRYNKNSLTKKDRLSEYHTLNVFIDNTLWMVLEAEKRKLNKVAIGNKLFDNVCYVFFTHLKFLEEPDIGKIYHKMLPIVLLYKSYDKFVSREYKYNSYYGQRHIYEDIPPISLNEFYNRVNQSYTEKKVS